MKSHSTPDDRRLAIADYRAGGPGNGQRDIGRRYRVAKTTVARWVAAADEADARADRVRAALPPSPPDCPALDGSDGGRELAEPPSEHASALAIARASLATARRQATDAAAAGDYALARAANRDVIAVLPVLARLEKSATDGADVIMVSRADLDRALEARQEQLAVLASRPLACASCGRDLAVKLAGGVL